jgi:purine-binding chemotaxis protein CheW
MQEQVKASPAAAPAAGSEPQQYLTFGLDGEILALGILRITEIIEYRGLTTVPMMPPFIRGVLNLRGAVVPVVDLRARFGRGPAPVSRKTCVIIVELRDQDGGDAGKQDIGVMVDQVNEVVEIAAEDIEPAPAFGSGLRQDFIKGMGKIGGKFVVLLELDNLLSITELSRAAAAATALGGPEAETGAEPDSAA